MTFLISIKQYTCMNLWMQAFTLPSNISSDPVYSETPTQLKPYFFISLSVPPELTIFILYFLRTFKIFNKLDLSDNDIRAFFNFSHLSVFFISQ